MIVVLAALAAALVGAAGPRVLRMLPEPQPHPDEAVGADTDDPKPLYVDLAAAPHLAVWLAASAGVTAAIVAARIPAELVPAWVVFCGVGAWLTYIDARTRLLPFLITAPTHLVCIPLVGLGAVLLDDATVFTRALVVNVLVFAIFWLIYQVGRRFGGGAFGYGDVRLAALMGLTLGALGGSEVLVATYGGFALGAVGGVVTSRLGWVDRTGFAFGPYLVVGAVIGAAWGPAIWPT